MENKPERIQRIENAIAEAANITVEDLYSRDRSRGVADARHAVWYIAHKHMHYSSPFIGKLYGRDHTTILNGVNRMMKCKASQAILEGIRKVCPDALEIPDPKEPRSVENWKF